MSIDYQPLILTFKLAFITTLILLLISIPISYWLNYSKFRFKIVIESIISMPLVLPPSVIGFYFLVAFAPQSTLGQLIEKFFNLRMVFTFEGLVLGSIIFSLPFMVNPLKSGFEAVNYSLIEASYTLGKSKFETLMKVILPNIKPSIIAASVMTFAHTVGEFGVVLMIGGNIPGKTKVASIAIFEEVESLNYASANEYSLVLIAITFAILITFYIINNKYFKIY